MCDRGCEICRVKFPAACCVKIDIIIYGYPVACRGVVHSQDTHHLSAPGTETVCLVLARWAPEPDRFILLHCRHEEL
jgi:hypothetical protein